MSTRTLLVLHDDPAFRSTLHQVAEEERCHLHFCRDWSELRARDLTSGALPLLVVHPLEPGSSEPCDALREFTRARPRVPVLAALDTRSVSPRTLLLLGEWGVRDVVCIRTDSRAAVRQRVRSAWRMPIERLLRFSFPSSLPATARLLLEKAAEVGATGGTVSDWARAMCMSERTLLRHCRRLGLPEPRRILLWIRILRAAEMLEEPGASLQRVALACGYGAESALRRAFQEALGRCPGELRRSGALQSVFAAFEALLGAGQPMKQIA